MIISLEEAQAIDKDITIETLQAFEEFIRSYTNNNFQNFDVRLDGNITFDGMKIKHNHDFTGFRKGDTIQVSNSKFNDGLYIIDSIEEDGTITVLKPTAYDEFIGATVSGAFVTLVKYPPTLKEGVKKLLEYDKKMGHKIGVKSETISRWTVSYHDQGKGQSLYGYPVTMFGFISPYIKVRW